VTEKSETGRTIQVSEEAYGRLAKLRREEETISDTIRRVVEFYEVGTLRRHRSLDIEELEFPVELTSQEKGLWLDFLRAVLEVGKDMTYVSEAGWGVL
jgi:predicted CopG family antitoxin